MSRISHSIINAIILNDTRRENNHLGCALVMENIEWYCKKYNINIRHFIRYPDDLELLAFSPEEWGVDLLIVNGEGTFHDDAPTALQFLDTVKAAKLAGIKTVMINFTWQNNIVLNGYLKYFDLLCAREVWSQAEVQRQGVECMLAKDMLLSSISTKILPEKITESPKEELVMIDSVDADTNTYLYDLSRKTKSKLYYMSDYHRSMQKRKYRLSFALNSLRGLCDLSLMTKRNFADAMSARLILSGRFHGVCLCILYQKPFLFMSSNTYKIESTLTSLGVSLNRHRVNRGMTVDDVMEKHSDLLSGDYSSEYSSLCRKFIAASINQSDELFSEITLLF